MDDGGYVVNNDNALALAQAARVELHRGSVSWRVIEAARGQYNFAYYDNIMQRLRAADLAPVVYIADNPTWAANTLCGPIDTTNPDMMAAFSSFIFKLAARYPEVKIWALYNEPDNGDYAVQGYTGAGCFGDYVTNDLNENGVNDRADYARMLAAARKAVHQANPHAQLASGAMAYDYFDVPSSPEWYAPRGGPYNYQFLPELFAYMQANPLPNGEQYMDLLMFNFYDVFSPNWQRSSSQLGLGAKAEVLQNLMWEYRLAFPLFVGETGVDSARAGEQKQANCLVMTMIRGKAFGLRGVIWWTFQDVPARDWGYGVVTANLEPKPSYYAFQTLARELNGYVFTQNLSGLPRFTNHEAYRFTQAGKTKLVIWSADIPTPGGGPPCALTRKKHAVTFAPHVSRIEIVTTTGQRSFVLDNGAGDLDPTVGTIRIQVGSDPVIVQPNP